MAWGSVMAFWAVSLMFVVTPGADWAYAISAGLRERTVLPAVGGMLTGHLIATVVVAAGVAAVVAESPSVMTALTILGALYLTWLGVGAVRHPPTPDVADTDMAVSPARQVLTGVGVSALNPKVLLLFLALLPQFTSRTAALPIWVQIVALGLVHIASCAVVYVGVGTAARRVLGARPQAARIVTRGSGVAMIVLGAFLLVERIV